MSVQWLGPLVLSLAIGGAAALMGGGAFGGAAAFAVSLSLGLLLANRRYLRRRMLDREPFPEAHREVLDEYVAFYEELDDPADRDRFEREVRYFIAEHTISGPEGAPVDDELKVLVGASAAILSFGRPGYTWARVRDVVVYPDAFDDDYAISEQGRILGQVGAQGPIIFSARALRQGFRGEADGLNVGLHEMAHVLDFGDGAADGVPTLMPWGAVRGWLHLMHDEVERIDAHRSVLRKYGATNEAEFFAVATEAFFERPRNLREEHPELYAMLRDTYGQDPAGPGAKAEPLDRSPEARRRRRNERKRRRRQRD